MASSGRDLGATHGEVGRAGALRSLRGEGGRAAPPPLCLQIQVPLPTALGPWTWYVAIGRKAAGPAQGSGAQAELEPSWPGESPQTSVDNSMNQRPLPSNPSRYSRGNHKIPQEPKNTWGTGSRVETGFSY